MPEPLFTMSLLPRLTEDLQRSILQYLTDQTLLEPWDQFKPGNPTVILN